MIHYLFDCCVASLDWLANKMNPWFPGGMDYAKINVILFCFIFPAILLTSLGLNAALLMGLL